MTAEHSLHGDGFRAEIQGLRAVAVLIVLVFHIWPGAMSGGYVGVDVFFVISGYLITGLLLRQAESTGRISITRFYAKRIKRLLPAATLVLVAVGTCVSILPVVRWDDTAMEIAASALYFENWWLAAKAVDYLAAESAPSPLQHFWSLSVEEQYYIVWPVLFAAVGLLGARLRSQPRLAFGVLLAVIGLGSLAYSIFITPRDPGLAYFATTTRAWELAIGGALAVFTGWERLKEPVRVILGWLGLAAILLSAWAYSQATPFPGYHALLPTVGSALMIVAGQSSRWWSSYTLLRSQPAQYFGDISYSLYLWHWPVVIFYGQIAGRELGLIDGVIVLAVSTALAHQTKYLVEDYFRRPSFASPQAWKPFVFGAACIAAALVSTASIRHQVDLRMAPSSPIATGDGSHHPGALALSDGAAFDPGVPFSPAPLAARNDTGDAYRDGCIASLIQDAVKECRYGDPAAKRKMVVVGDSHAVHWIPTLQLIAEQDGWRLTAITKSACPLAVLDDPAEATDQTRSCLTWNRAALARVLELKPELVVFAHSVYSLSKLTPERETSARMVADGIVDAWQRIESGGARVVAIRDTPKFHQQVPDCMAANGATIASCSRPRAEALVAQDPLIMAAADHGQAKLVDLTDAICGRDTCAPVVGNVFVWRDSHHLTATYARSLAPALSRAMAPLVGEYRPEAAGSGRTGKATAASADRPAPATASATATLPPETIVREPRHDRLRQFSGRLVQGGRGFFRFDRLRDSTAGGRERQVYVEMLGPGTGEAAEMAARAMGSLGYREVRRSGDDNSIRMSFDAGAEPPVQLLIRSRAAHANLQKAEATSSIYAVQVLAP